MTANGSADPHTVDADPGEDGLRLPAGSYSLVVGSSDTMLSGTNLSTLLPGIDTSGDYLITLRHDRGQKAPGAALLSPIPAKKEIGWVTP